MQETYVQSLGQEDPLERKWQPTLVFLPGEFHGQRSLADYCPGGRKELNMTKQLTLTIHVSVLGKFTYLLKFTCDPRVNTHGH